MTRLYHEVLLSHRLYNQLNMKNTKNLRSLVSLTIFILCILFSILIILSPWNSMKEKKNQSQTTVEVEKTKVSLIDFGATIPYNLDEACGTLVHWFIGDDTCDDDINNEKCYYDHGDCCLNEIDDHKCTECICHEDGTRHPSRFGTTTEEPNLCADYHYIGDGVCDDSTNNEVCDFDGNDCCIDEIVDYFCSDCICHPPILGLNECDFPLERIGDGFCDNLAANSKCDFDAGDCIDDNGLQWLYINIDG